MAYLGKDVVGIMSYSRAKDTMTGDGSTTTLTLSRDPGTQNNVEIYMDGVLQTPGVEYTLSGKVVTFTTAPETGLNVVALSGTETEILEPADNSVVASHLVGGLSLSDAKIAGLSSSKLSGALPALDGSVLTNMPSGINVKSASDPAIDTNHANGVGTTWVNTTSGEMFVCTDATTDANVWTNVGSGSGDVVPWAFQGENYGYISGGWIGPAGGDDAVDKFSFASNNNGTDVLNLTYSRWYISGVSSSAYAFTSGGVQVPGNTYQNIIDKFAFANNNDATDVGDITVPRMGVSSQSSSTHGYASGGWLDSASDVIEKFSVTSDGNAVAVGTLSFGGQLGAGHNSSTHGYISGRRSGATYYNNIDKYSFASEGAAVDIADLTSTTGYAGGTSSTTHGYSAGGVSDNYINIISKFTFAADNDATDVGDITVTRYGVAPQSSTTHGYSSGGYDDAAGGNRNIIDKFSFSVDNNATDVGDISNSRQGSAGQQY